jgi:hypothetical protein
VRCNGRVAVDELNYPRPGKPAIVGPGKLGQVRRTNLGVFRFWTGPSSVDAVTGHAGDLILGQAQVFFIHLTESVASGEHHRAGKQACNLS